jgi:hypothetical protein
MPIARATVGGGTSSTAEWYVHSASMERLARRLLGDGVERPWYQGTT